MSVPLLEKVIMTVPLTLELETKYVRIAFTKPVTMPIEAFNQWLKGFMSSRLFRLMVTDIDEFSKLASFNFYDWITPNILEFQIIDQAPEDVVYLH